ncbi:hypothetical protein [Lysinibacillus halotolerans]|uniref:Lipoprotein n=1 Tax=Lysinibacillus halotolerans TaxID=1368476 RepID=A0A3M8H9V2_9BACI|nr:hypothetical protein [Lysinibacillus halotolerans]RNC99078.1 hypothetical protein EC501_08765 [Lysinibacillus halotolerans]
MKKIFMLILTICFVILVGGCMQTSDEENAQNVEAMLNYINTKYNESFKEVEYIPGEKGLNDFKNQNTLIAENDLGITILVTEFLGKKGEYQDNYRNMLASYLFKKELRIEDLSYITNSKFYVSGYIQDTDEVDVNDLKNNFTHYIPSLNSINAFIYINEPIESVDLEEIYNLYSKINTYNFEINTFSIGFEGDINKSSEYLEKYRYLGKLKRWNEYDESLNKYMRLLQETNLTFEEFKNRLYEGKNE